MVASLTGTVKMQDFITAGIVLKSITSEVILIRAYTFIHGVTGLSPQGWSLWTASSALGQVLPTQSMIAYPGAWGVQFAWSMIC